jgi:DNA polymerase alpha subunit A
MADRSRREKKSKLDKLAEYKRAREGGGRSWKVGVLHYSCEFSCMALFQVEDDVDIYDEVTEDQYKSIVKGRLQKDDFVVDDGIEGYMDNGMDDWGTESGAEERTPSDDEYDAKRTSELILFVLRNSNQVFCS